jgi:hypothetical protein
MLQATSHRTFGSPLRWNTFGEPPLDGRVGGVLRLNGVTPSPSAGQDRCVFAKSAHRLTPTACDFRFKVLDAHVVSQLVHQENRPCTARSRRRPWQPP